jgi:hypothetical protein
MMTISPVVRTVAKASALLAAAVALAACSGGGGGGVGISSITPPTGVNFFGNNFAADFNASSTSTPVVPQSGDIIPLSLTTYPQPLS